jgi:hypothetical protein
MGGDSNLFAGGGQRQIRCALFVDFDNVYLGLRRLDLAAAESFAANPARWLGRLEVGADALGAFSRRLMVRACYLNPGTFGRFRASFTSAGFRVVDCPSLTQQGKSSADINMALDAMGALGGPTHYDEFVIVSADADFTPLALRCREGDRRVTIITAGPAASAYRAVADSVLNADDLIELLSARAPADLDGTAASVPGEVDALGAAVVEGTVAEPVAAAAVVAGVAAVAVMRALRAARGPVVSASLAHTAHAADPDLRAAAWGGHGTFTAWLVASVPEAGFCPRPSPGYGWDRERFTEADLPETDRAQLGAAQRQVANVTDTPWLSAAACTVMLNAVADEVNTHPFHGSETSRRVRDACQEAGQNVARAAITYVTQCILYSGLKLQPPVSAGQLAAAWADSVQGLCHGARLDLDGRAGRGPRMGRRWPSRHRSSYLRPACSPGVSLPSGL